MSQANNDAARETAGRSQVRFVTIGEKNETQRIDNFLLSLLKGIPKSKVYRVIRKGEVRINKKRCKPETKLALGDVVRIPPVFGLQGDRTPPKVSDSLSDYLENAVLYEDKALMVINKPSGLAVHGGSGIHLGLIEALRQRRPEHAFLELVHRIDRDTSGCVLVAKSRSALRFMHELFRNDRVDKTYHLAVFGRWARHRRKVDAPLRKNELQSGERMVTVSQDGKPSQTLFRIIETSTHFSLLEAKPVSGRTHQIRVHAAHSGHPIVGDAKYIPSSQTEFHGMKKSRLMLHARSLECDLPDGNRLSVAAPYDEPFTRNLIQMGFSVDAL